MLRNVDDYRSTAGLRGRRGRAVRRQTPTQRWIVPAGGACQGERKATISENGTPETTRALHAFIALVIALGKRRLLNWPVVHRGVARPRTATALSQLPEPSAFATLGASVAEVFVS